MDKYIQALCKQNPTMKMECGNPECKAEFKINSKKFFENKTYTNECVECNKTTDYDTSKVVKEFAAMMKKMGVTVK